MYSVSDLYKTAIQDNTRSFTWSGTITTKAGRVYPFENKDIVKGSGYVTRQCSGSSEIELGSVYAAELGISLFSDVDRYSLEDAEVRLNFHMSLPDGNTEDVPMGIFYVAEANRQIKTLELKAYDAMLNFEKAYNKDQSSGYPFDFLTAMSTSCHVELSQTQAEIEALPNGTELLGVYPDNDIETWRDFLHYLSQALCCFAFINREGKLQLVQYTAAPVVTVNSTHRYSSSFSDFVTRYTAINSTNRRTNTAEYYSLDPDDGLTMNLEVNPLLQFGLDETRKRILNNILNGIAVINYVPFDSETIGDPALEPGDVLTFTGGQADASQMAAITSITVKVNGKCSLKCVGKNPRLAEAKSKNDKNITGLLNSVEATKMATYTYVNAMPYTLGEENVEIVSIEFATQEETDCEFKAAILLNVAAPEDPRSVTATGTGTTILPEQSTNPETEEPVVTDKELATTVTVPVEWTDDGQSVIRVTYIVDGHEVEEFHPMETLHSGQHILNLFYPLLDMQEKTLHSFAVWISLAPGSATINAQNIIASITGQGLGAQDRWNGRIDASDDYIPLLLSGMSHFALSGEVDAALITPTPTGAGDQIPKVLMAGMPLWTIADNLRIYAPIVHDVIEISDKRKMRYSKIYVFDDTQFELRESYTISGGTEQDLNRGRMDALKISTSDFDSLTGLTILPFETEPFIGGDVLPAKKLSGTHYTVLENGSLVLKKTYAEIIEGEPQAIDRGTLASYPLGLASFDTITELEVQSG
ncbi:MAG TPA: hypothetical protein PLN48_09450 [Lachnospiraceae bacterium]|jgi:hypothetical protein|uniref:hypothetical protein n=1 Tax=Xylanivirga thermophila TaxID=2496273 RepID=UPI002CBE6D72|nr:hypothetical protein [Lachnospiraceae bacterium]